LCGISTRINMISSFPTINEYFTKPINFMTLKKTYFEEDDEEISTCTG